MNPATQSPNVNRSISRFDLAVWSVVLACGLVIALVAQRSGSAAGQLRFLYLTVNEIGQSQIHLAILADEKATPDSRSLTPADNAVWDFFPTPDGSSVIYSVVGELGISDLWQVSLASGHTTPLLPCPEAACSNGRLGPDGRLLVYTRRNLTAFTAAFFSPPRLWVLDTASGENAALFADGQRLGLEARWSFDGQWLSFVSPEPAGLGIYNVNDGREALFTNATNEAGEWSPTAPYFLTTSAWQQNEEYVIHLMRGDAESSELIDLSGEDALVQDSSGNFSPDGEWIAFRRKLLTGPQATRGKQIWVMAKDGSGAYQLTADPDADFGPPVWSPDGRYLLARRFSLQGAHSGPTTWLLDIDQKEARLLVEPGDQPVWIP